MMKEGALLPVMPLVSSAEAAKARSGKTSWRDYERTQIADMAKS